jgi:hypothetical protein
MAFTPQALAAGATGPWTERRGSTTLFLYGTGTARVEYSGDPGATKTNFVAEDAVVLGRPYTLELPKDGLFLRVVSVSGGAMSYALVT